MLASLSIRDVVLIERLDLRFGPGLTVLTGETGAGKSILLDSLGLALGQRAESGMVRTGQAQASVTAVFAPAPDHPAFAMLAEQGMEGEEEIVVRRVVNTDGRSRAFVNGEPVGVGLLRRLGTLLVEVQGQHDQVGLADPGSHGGLLDAFGGLEPRRRKAGDAFRAWKSASRALREAQEAIAAAQRDEEWLRHAVGELSDLAPEEGEEEALASERQHMQQGERRAEAIASALAELQPRDRRGGSGPAAALRNAARALERLPAPNEEAAPALAALAAAQDALAEAESLLERLSADFGPDPRRLEQLEERLFALRAAARKHAVPVVELPGLLLRLKERLGALDAGTGRVAKLEAEARSARDAFIAAGADLTAARTKAARELEKATARELAPLKLDRARLHIEIVAREEPAWAADGVDRITFLVSTNPGQTPGQLAKIASGGELSRLMLALKVVLARGSPVPTLVFDEVDSGIGGATAAAVGERLSRVADRLQVLVVTHSPQVAARGTSHLRVAKGVRGDRAETRVEPLDLGARREEIARMLAGETITEAARAAADDLLAGAA
ncbi:DNA repair protein RecN [Roseomonas gilardii]|uniref:DNA repair protein RecN n=1 Tax=Roseomonas gilardii TaxID=257708 RepID=A0A1L7AGW5_9PROT|nr:DNA repair protein RecN [Roseomonas gilardii]APT57960.1 DNA repair protein RecN [Roseomonas gilardii]MDT8332461.1 DNA repair protein RecN [Roseomonas gilardii]PZR17066.1 MAG: DNA repair protein RecN [Azospirillum brasilense]